MVHCRLVVGGINVEVFLILVIWCAKVNGTVNKCQRDHAATCLLYAYSLVVFTKGRRFGRLRDHTCAKENGK